MSTASLRSASAPARPQLPPLPALVTGQVTHRRPGPVRHAFRHRVYQWLVDLDCLPRQPWYLRAFAHFSSADHLGDPGLPIKRNIENYLALGGIALGDRGRVLMLANARVLGSYELRFTLTPDLVATTVTLRRHDAVAFTATFRGNPEPATRPALARRLIRQPLMPQRISALIRVHGIWLWLHRLPIRSRPHHTPQEGV